MKKVKTIKLQVFYRFAQLIRFSVQKSETLNHLSIFSVFPAFLFLLCYLFFPLHLNAQTDDENLIREIAPPPLNVVSKDELKKLEKVTKMKDRTKLALELMEARLVKSEELLNQNDYQSSLNQIGVYQGLLINHLKFLERNNNRKGVLKNYKKLEMNLRDVLPRLEILRREMPYKYSYHIKNMMFFVRESRTDALKPLFDDTVLPEGSN